MKNKLNYINTVIKVLIFVLLFMLNLHNNISFAVEELEIKLDRQIDLKNNIEVREYGRYDHSVKTYTKEMVDEHTLVVSGSILDYPNYRGFVRVYDLQSNVMKQYLLPYECEYKVNVKKDNYNGNILISGINEMSDTNYIFVMLIDKDLNLIYNSTITADSTNTISGINSIIMGISNEKYNIAYVDKRKSIKYFKFSKTMQLQEYKIIEGNSLTNIMRLIAHPNGNIWAIYSASINSKQYKYFEVDKAKTVYDTTNLWLYYNEKIIIENALVTNDNKTLIYGNGKYILLNENDRVISSGNLDELTEYKQDLILNKIINSEDYFYINENVKLKFLRNELRTMIGEECVDFVQDKNITFNGIINEKMIFKSSDNNYNRYYIINEDGKINLINTQYFLLNITNDKAIFSKGNKNIVTLNETIYVCNLNLKPKVIVTNYKNADTIYVGNNGLVIEGFVQGDSDLNAMISMNINGVRKEQEIDLTLDNKFSLKWEANELMEGNYTDLTFELNSCDLNYNVYADELKIGDIVCYNNVKYVKINTNRYLELYPENCSSIVKKNISESEWKEFLTLEEFNNVKDCINQNKDLYRYWLSNKQVVNHDMSINKAPGKAAYSYIRKVINIDFNKKFRYNSYDKVYYACNDEANESFKLGFDIEVSKRNPSKPLISVIPKSEGYVSEDVIIQVHSNDTEATTKYIINDDVQNIFVYNDEIRITETGMYKYQIFNEYNNGNTSEIEEVLIKIDKLAPQVSAYEYENSYNEWTRNEKTNLNIYIDEKDSGLSENVLKEYSIAKISDDKYFLTKEIRQGETFELELVDNANNSNKYEFTNNMKVDRKCPVFETEQFNYDIEGVHILLEAKDYESGLKNIYYKINDDDWKQCEDKIFLKRNTYDRNTEFEYYAVDNVGNETNIYRKDINLNDKPILEISNEKELKYQYDLSEDLEYSVKTEDLDKNDVLQIEFKVCDNNDEILHTEIIDNVSTSLTLEINKNIFENIKYEEDIYTYITLTDGLEHSTYIHKFTKINMKPNIVIDNYVDELFEDFIEFDINVNDLDNDELRLKIVNQENDIIYNDKVKKGFNKIILSDVLDTGKSQISFIVSDGKERTKIDKKINVLKKIELDNNEILILKLKHKHSPQFYNMIYKKLNDTNSCLIIIKDNIETNKVNIMNSNLMLDFKELKEIRSDVSKGYIFGDVSENDIQNYINQKRNKTSNNVYELGQDINISDFVFDDLERDFYVENKGKDRLIQICHDTYKFENHNGVINHNGEYDYDLDKWNEELYLPYESYSFDNTNTICKYDNLRFKLNRIGRYILNIKEKDHIIDEGNDYSLYSSDYNYKFYVHRRPEVSLNYEYVDENHIKIIKSSYDLDFYSKNKGIKTEELYMCIKDYDGNIIEENIKIENENYIKIDNSYITEITYKVYDFGIDKDVENEYTLSNEKTLQLNTLKHEISCDFEYYIGDNNANRYVYKGNVGNETVRFIDYVNIINKDSIKEKYYEICEDDFNVIIGDNGTYNNKDLSNKLIIKDEFNNVVASEEKEIKVKEIIVNNLTEDNYTDIEKGFVRNELAEIKVEINNNVTDDLNVFCNGNLMIRKRDKIYTYELDISNTTSDEFEYEITTKSKRDNSLITLNNYSNKVYDDVKLYDFNVNYVADLNLSNITNSNPRFVDTLPVGKHDECKIKKGYSFRFSVSSTNMLEDNDYIIIKPTIYHYDEYTDERKEVKVMREKLNGEYEEYNVNIILNEHIIGTNDMLRLSSTERVDEIWHGKYFIPHDAIIINDNNIIESGNLIVNFQIEAYKDGIRKFTYVPDTWIKEQNFTDGIYECGDVAIYTNEKTLNEDIIGTSLY